MVVEDNQACACLLAAHVLSISAHDKSGALHCAHDKSGHEGALHTTRLAHPSGTKSRQQGLSHSWRRCRPRGGQVYTEPLNAQSESQLLGGGKDL